MSMRKNKLYMRSMAASFFKKHGKRALLAALQDKHYGIARVILEMYYDEIDLLCTRLDDKQITTHQAVTFVKDAVDSKLNALHLLCGCVTAGWAETPEQVQVRDGLIDQLLFAARRQKVLPQLINAKGGVEEYKHDGMLSYENWKRTPLHLACHNLRAGAVRCLLGMRRVTDAHVQDADGHTPYNMLLQAGKPGDPSYNKIYSLLHAT